MEAKIISTECIKPSSSIPLHLKTHNLSLLDQFRPHMYFPVALYYPINQDINLTSPTDIHRMISKRLQLLKQSLSETLARFHQFAGKLNDDNLSVDCKDKGIYFVESRVDSPLNEFLNQPDLFLINKLLRSEAGEHSGSIAGIRVAKIQVTTFECGGLICLSHLFGDGITLSLFQKNWAATACKSTEAAKCPNNDVSYLFPQNNDATRRFVFDAKAIATLKAKATSSWVQNLTRAEAASTVLSKSIMAAFKAKSSSLKPTLLTHLVNLRRKARPPLSEYSMGKIVWMANALCTDDEPKLDGLVCQLREAVKKIDGIS